jgi:hypothetical protein
MTRLLLTADWHLTDNPRDVYRWGAVEQVRKVAAKYQVTDLFILGDLTDSGDHHSAAFTNRVVQTLSRFAEQCNVHIIRGTLSHDGSDPSLPFFRFINRIGRLYYTTEVTIWNAEDFRVLLVPSGQWPDQLPDDVDAVFAHETFAGAVTESGVKLGGLRMPMSDIPIFSGDIHVPQTRGMLTYVGAPTLIDFGDKFQPRVLILDTDNAVSVDIHGPTKRLIKVKVSPDGEVSWPVANRINKGDLIKVRARFSGAVPSLAHMRADITEHITKRGGIVYAIIPMVDKHSAAMPTRPASRDDRDLVRQYGMTHSLDAPTVEAGLDILKSKGETP